MLKFDESWELSKAEYTFQSVAQIRRVLYQAAIAGTEDAKLLRKTIESDTKAVIVVAGIHTSASDGCPHITLWFTDNGRLEMGRMMHIRVTADNTNNTSCSWKFVSMGHSSSTGHPNHGSGNLLAKEHTWHQLEVSFTPKDDRSTEGWKT